MKCSVSALLVLASVALSGQTSQPPAPGRGNANRQAQEASKREAQPTQPSQNQTPVVENVTVAQPEANHPQPKQGADYYGTVADWWMVGLTLAGLAATIVLVVVAMKQFATQTKQTNAALRFAGDGLEATRESNRQAAAAYAIAAQAARVAEEAVHKTERADFQLDEIKITSGKPNLNEQTIFTFVFRNYGRTRASQIDLKFLVGIDGAYRPQVELAHPHKPTQAAGTSFEFSLRPMGQWLTAGEIARIDSGDLSFGFSTTLTYQDVFGKTHWIKNGGLHRVGAYSGSGAMTVTESESSD